LSETHMERAREDGVLTGLRGEACRSRVLVCLPGAKWIIGVRVTAGVGLAVTCLNGNSYLQVAIFRFTGSLT